MLRMSADESIKQQVGIIFNMSFTRLQLVKLATIDLESAFERQHKQVWTSYEVYF